MDTARDRIIGILVGNFAVYIISTLVWPTPVTTVIRRKLADAARKVAEIAAAPENQRMDMISTVAETECLLNEVRYCFYLLPFEPSGLRPSAKRKTFNVAVDQLASLNKDVYFSSEAIPDAVARLNVLSLQIGSIGRQEEALSDDTTSLVAEVKTAGAKQIDMHLTHLERALADGKV